MNALPTSLERFESQLESAIRRQRRPRRLALRLAVAALIAAAAALGVASALPGDDPSTVARAAAALNPSGDTILHTVVVTATVRPDGTTSTDRTETWQKNSAPYDGRSVSGDGERRRELALADGRPQYYDARTNAIHTTAPDAKLPPPSRLRLDMVEQRLVQLMRDLLASGQAREAGRVTIGGREGVRLVAEQSNLSMVVDAQTFEPLEWRTVGDDGTRLTSRFETYELLQPTPANLALLSLTKQHPGATIEPGKVTVEGF